MDVKSLTETLLTQRNKKPSPGWLRFVKSAAARKKISSALRKTAAAAS